MSYTDQTLALDAYERLKAINPAAPPSLIPRLRTMVPAALVQLARMNAQSLESELLNSSFVVTATDGVAPLADVVNADEPLLLDVDLEVSLPGHTFPLERVPDTSTLQIEEAVEFGFFAIEGLFVHVREPDSEYGTYSGSVTLSGTRIPLSSTIPLQLQGQAVNILVGSLMPQGA